MSSSIVQEFRDIIMNHAFPDGSDSKMTRDEIQKIVLKYSDMPGSVTSRRVRDALDSLWLENKLRYEYQHNGIKLLWSRK